MHDPNKRRFTRGHFMCAARPSSSKFWKAYLNYDSYKTSSAAWDQIGGAIGKSYGPDGNSCASRVSYGLNYSGALVQQFNSSASVNLKAHSYNGKAGDGLRYITSAMQLAGYLKKNWGAPNHAVKKADQLAKVIDSLANDQCAVFATPNPPGGRGHAGVLKKGYTDPYVLSYLPVDVWILP
jgi:hypothetical protein